MTVKEQEELALQIATEAHEGQFRKDGVTPYITHPIEVAKLVKSEVEYSDKEYLVAVAYLHDVLEDTKVTIKELAEKGISRRVIADVVELSRFDGESYWEYIQRVCEKDSIRIVKVADIVHNLSTLTENMSSMRERYFKALLTLGDF